MNPGEDASHILEDNEILNGNSDLQQLMEGNFLLVDAGCPKKRGQARINPKNLRLHCSWEATGTRQVFLDHILQRACKAGRRCCEHVPDDIRAQFEKAISGTAATTGDDKIEE